ncbi:glycosyltransferase [Ornithinimicrobium panacihumi]|uniref:glycosyltransferase n=1 Tax=Ornithinimicrobium panacihumi TaxID=2008449 RepID=UPI003F8A396E
MTDLVVVSLEVWDEVWRRNQHLVAGLLRQGAVDRVLFVEPAIDDLHAIRSGRLPRDGDAGLREIHLDGVASGRLWAYRPRKLLPRRIDPRGDQRRARAVARQADRLGMTRPCLWVNDPGGAEVLRLTGWPALYDITDDWLLADRPEPELVRLRRQEDALLSHCQEVVVCSESLRRSKSAHRRVNLIPNAVDVEPYRTRQPRPADLPHGRTAVYLGTAHRDRVDVDLCLEVARRLAEPAAGQEPAHLVLVGPAPLPDQDLRRLREAGVRLLGARPSSLVPAYLQHADVLLVPHVLTEFTASLDPIKAYEYRAARRPVVSTPVPGFVDAPDPLVRSVLAEEFPQAVTDLITDPVPWTGELPPDIPTWSRRVEEMASVIARASGHGR